MRRAPLSALIPSLSCPLCGSTDIVYSEDSGEYVCARCGTVVIEGVEAEVLYAKTRPEEFVDHQMQRIRKAQSAQEWRESQTFHLEDHQKTIEDAKHRRALMLNSLVRHRKWQSKWISIIEDYKVIVCRTTDSGRKVVKAVANFSYFPSKIELTIVKSKPIILRGTYRRAAKYYAERHTIVFSEDLSKKLSDYHKQVLMTMLSKVLLEFFTYDLHTTKPRGIYKSERTIANFVAYTLIRAGLAKKPYDYVPGKGVVFKDVEDIMLDGQPLSGRKAYDPVQTTRRNNPEKAKLIKKYLEEAVKLLKEANQKNASGKKKRK